MRFTLFLTACHLQTHFEALLTIQPTFVEVERAFNACGLTLVSFTRFHN